MILQVSLLAARVDEALDIRVTGLTPGERSTLRLSLLEPPSALAIGSRVCGRRRRGDRPAASRAAKGLNMRPAIRGVCMVYAASADDICEAHE